MSSAPVQASAGISPAAAGFRSNRAADVLMRRILGVREIDARSGTGAHKAFRTSVVMSGIRCLITYLLIPVLVPILSLAGWIAAPIGIVLCVVAVVNGIVSLRRFWRSDHRYRWMYTAFIGVVFLILALAMYSEIDRLVVLT